MITLILLGGCGSSNKEQTGATQAGDTASAVEESSIQSSAKSEEKEPEAFQFEPQAVYDADGLKVTAKGIEDGFMGPELKLEVENSSSESWVIQARNVSVNGMMVDPVMSIEVAPGKKANDEMTLMNSQLKDAGVEDIAQVEFNLHFFKPDNFESSFDSELISLKLSEGDGSAGEVTGDVLLDADGVRIISTGMKDDSFLGKEIGLVVENSSDQPVTVQARDMSVNGYMVSPVFSCDVMPGKKASDSITIMKSDLEDNDIETIEDVELSFHIFNTNDFGSGYDTEMISIQY